MQPDENTIVYTPNRADIVAFNIKILLRKKLWWGVTILCFLIIIVADLTAPNDHHLTKGIIIGVSIMSGVLITAFVWVFTFICLIASVWTGKFKNILTEQTTSITQDGLIGKSAVGEGLLRWQGIDRMDSTNRLLIIYTNETTGKIIPKRFFSSSQSAIAFELAIRTKMPAKS